MKTIILYGDSRFAHTDGLGIKSSILLNLLQWFLGYRIVDQSADHLALTDVSFSTGNPLVDEPNEDADAIVVALGLNDMTDKIAYSRVATHMRRLLQHAAKIDTPVAYLHPGDVSITEEKSPTNKLQKRFYKLETAMNDALESTDVAVGKLEIEPSSEDHIHYGMSNHITQAIQLHRFIKLQVLPTIK